MRRRLRAARVPADGSSSPPRTRSSVVLPDPFGPTRPTWSPSKIPKDRSSKSGAAPNALVSACALSSSSATSAGAPAHERLLRRTAQPLDPPLLAEGGRPVVALAGPHEDDREARARVPGRLPGLVLDQ